MRKVRKGLPPNIYSHWGQALNDLYDRIGCYCSYCEIPIQNMGEVEHIVPRSKGGAPLDWDNFLLGCKYCNTSKSRKNPSRLGYTWPDTHQTDTFFEYIDFLVEVSGTLPAALQKEAADTIALVGLDKNPGHPKFNPKDQRWKNRALAFERAGNAEELYSRNRYNVGFIDLIVSQATSCGFFSIWYTAFDNYPEVKIKLKAEFPGTDVI